MDLYLSIDKVINSISFIMHNRFTKPTGIMISKTKLGYWNKLSVKIWIKRATNQPGFLVSKIQTMITNIQSTNLVTTQDGINARDIRSQPLKVPNLSHKT